MALASPSIAPDMDSEVTGRPLMPDRVTVPERYIKGCLGDMAEAQRRWDLTLKWRDENNIDNILSETFPEIDLIKACYPHSILGRARDGNLVYYEHLGKIDIAKMKEAGLTMSRLIRYYIYQTEYMWRVLDLRASDDGKVVTVMNVSGVGLKDLRGEAMEFMRTTSDLMQSHYVERSCRILVINAPLMFSLVWAVVKPFINERTRAKISIVGSDYKKELLKHIAPENLPQELGGENPTSIGSSAEELQFRHFIEGSIADAAKEERNKDAMPVPAAAGVTPDQQNST